MVGILFKRIKLAPCNDGVQVYTLTFAAPPLSDGQTTPLGVRMDYGDVVKVVVPDYKPKSFSMSAHRPGEFDITYKAYPGGRASGYLDRVKVGETINVFRTGNKLRQEGIFVGIIAYGVGITEALPLAESCLMNKKAVGTSAAFENGVSVPVVILLWASRTLADTFWHDRLHQLHIRHGPRFRWVNILSREPDHHAAPHYHGIPPLRGRVTAEILQQVFDATWGTHSAGPNEALRGKTSTHCKSKSRNIWI